MRRAAPPPRAAEPGGGWKQGASRLGRGGFRLTSQRRRTAPRVASKRQRGERRSPDGPVLASGVLRGPLGGKSRRRRHSRNARCRADRPLLLVVPSGRPGRRVPCARAERQAARLARIRGGRTPGARHGRSSNGHWDSLASVRMSAWATAVPGRPDARKRSRSRPGTTTSQPWLPASIRGLPAIDDSLRAPDSHTALILHTVPNDARNRPQMTDRTAAAGPRKALEIRLIPPLGCAMRSGAALSYHGSALPTELRGHFAGDSPPMRPHGERVTCVVDTETTHSGEVAASRRVAPRRSRRSRPRASDGVEATRGGGGCARTGARSAWARLPRCSGQDRGLVPGRFWRSQS
jgi:hypothetical protein